MRAFTFGSFPGDPSLVEPNGNRASLQGRACNKGALAWMFEHETHEATGDFDRIETRAQNDEEEYQGNHPSESQLMSGKVGEPQMGVLLFF